MSPSDKGKLIARAAAERDAIMMRAEAQYKARLEAIEWMMSAEAASATPDKEPLFQQKKAAPAVPSRAASPGVDTAINVSAEVNTALRLMPSEFNLNMLYQHIQAQYPGIELSRLAVAAAIKRLKKDRKLEVVREGDNRNPATLRIVK